MTKNEDGLPPFIDQGYSEARRENRISHRNQAIITSYRLNCCGNITEWGVDLKPNGTIARSDFVFDFIFQVWRPAPDVNVSGCYSLVDDFISTGIPIEIQPTPSTGVVRITPSPADQLQFQPGDVLGFYVESHGQGSGPYGDADNGVVLLTSGSYTNELVWYGSIGAATAQISQTGSCPYPIGTTRVLRLSTSAAPVISISISTYSCHQSLSTTVTSSIGPPFSIQHTYSSYNSHPSSARDFSASKNIHVPSATSLSTPTSVANVPGSMIYHIGLTSGIVAASIVVCISTVMATIIIIALVIAKRCRKIVTLSNQAYGELQLTRTIQWNLRQRTFSIKDTIQKTFVLRTRFFAPNYTFNVILTSEMRKPLY